jgi:hypothetical protein
MRYVRLTDFKLNPRQEIPLLDAVIKRWSTSRYTFTEEEALGTIWASGEDIRLREDTRFWEIEGTNHFQLAEHKLANELLADRLWQGVWDGTDLESELEKLDTTQPASFHVFCKADPRFVKTQTQLRLTASPVIVFAEPVQSELNRIAGDLLKYHLEHNLPLNTRQLIEIVLRINSEIGVAEDDVDQMVSWLYTRSEWSEIGRGLWFPTELIPPAEPPQRIRVFSVGCNGQHTFVNETFIDEETKSEAKTVSGTTYKDPPVERHPDSSVSWIHVLRTVHLLRSYVPVPTGARFRYPRFVGRSGPLAINTLFHDLGREGFLWLDRDHNRFFGEFLEEMVQWEEAGRKLLINWKPDGVVIRLGEVDCEVQSEELRHLDPEVLRELRLGKGESYRQSLVEILKEIQSGLSFRDLYERLALRQNHKASRGSIRAVLSQSPEFVCQNSVWKWRAMASAASTFRRRMVLADLAANSNTDVNDLGSVAEAVAKKIRETLAS